MATEEEAEAEAEGVEEVEEDMTCCGKIRRERGRYRIYNPFNGLF